MKEKINIGFLTSADPFNKKSWSGTHYRMAKSLEMNFENVIYLRPDPYSFVRLKVFVIKIFSKVILRKKYCHHNQLISREYGNYFNKKIKTMNIDVIFAPSASVEIANLETQVPVCYFTDTTFAQICGYYDSYSHFSAKAQETGNKIEQAAINKSTTQVFSSQWALDFAKRHYGAKKTHVVKMGANIDTEPTDKNLVKYYNSTINILFVGVDWKRKGGDIVYQTIDALDKKGYDFELTVCGCVPHKTHPRMKVISFLDKNKEEDMLQLQELFKKSHLFFLPTRAECFGMVFCEANAYGLPVVTTDTGGVSSIIENGVNGYALPIEAKSDKYVTILEELITDKRKIMKMSTLARERYEKELNWKKWGEKMKKILLLTSCTDA